MYTSASAHIAYFSWYNRLQLCSSQQPMCTSTRLVYAAYIHYVRNDADSWVLSGCGCCGPWSAGITYSCCIRAQMPESREHTHTNSNARTQWLTFKSELAGLLWRMPHKCSLAVSCAFCIVMLMGFRRSHELLSALIRVGEGEEAGYAMYNITMCASAGT